MNFYSFPLSIIVPLIVIYLVQWNRTFWRSICWCWYCLWSKISTTAWRQKNYQTGNSYFHTCEIYHELNESVALLQSTVVLFNNLDNCYFKWNLSKELNNFILFLEHVSRDMEKTLKLFSTCCSAVKWAISRDILSLILIFTFVVVSNLSACFLFFSFCLCFSLIVDFLQRSRIKYFIRFFLLISDSLVLS